MSGNHGDGLLRSPFRKELSTRLQRSTLSWQAPSREHPQDPPQFWSPSQGLSMAEVARPGHQGPTWDSSGRHSGLQHSLPAALAENFSDLHHSPRFFLPSPALNRLLPFTCITHPLPLKKTLLHFKISASASWRTQQTKYASLLMS